MSDELREALAEALDGNLPRMAFQMYGQYLTDDPAFDIEDYYLRVAAEILEEPRVRAALAARPDSPTLDVERLARVLEYVGDGDGDGYHGTAARQYAKNIIRAYDATEAPERPA